MTAKRRATVAKTAFRFRRARRLAGRGDIGGWHRGIYGMTIATHAEATASPGIRQTTASAARVGPWDVLALAAWCGLAAGWLEVATRLLARAINPTRRLNMMSRHYVWTIPLSNLLLFFVAGACLALATRRPPRAAAWLSPRVFCAAAMMPALMVAVPQIYPWAWLILARNHAASGACVRAEFGPNATVDQMELPGPAGLGRGRRMSCVRCGVAQTTSGIGPTHPRGRSAERALDRARHRPGRSLELVRISARHQPNVEPAREAGHHIHGGAGHRSVDPRFARQHVHRPLAP